MKTATKQIRQCKSIISQPLLALAFALVVGAMAMAPALADNHDNHQGNWNNGRGNGGYHGYGHGYHDERHGYPSYYRQPYIYAPPPAYYAPVPSPGINLVFPLHIR